MENLFHAFQPFQETLGQVFFKDEFHLTGAEVFFKDEFDLTTARKVTLKSIYGIRITLEEFSREELWVSWLVPDLEDSKQMLCPYNKQDWERLIARTRNASSFIPLPALRFTVATAGKEDNEDNEDKEDYELSRAFFKQFFGNRE